MIRHDRHGSTERAGRERGPGRLSLSQSWLVGSRGLRCGTPEGSWVQVGSCGYPVLSLCPWGERLLVGVTGGLWEIVPGEERWVQRHDETVTEVLAVQRLPGASGVVVGCPYGIATSRVHPSGVWRWTFLSDDLCPDERFSSVVRPDPLDPDRLFVGTEAGLLIRDLGAGKWHRTGLAGAPVRCLIHAHDRYWAGADSGGVLVSRDGWSWGAAGRGLESDGVFSLAAWEGGVLAGTQRGVAAGDGESSWRLSGPRALVSALGSHVAEDGALRWVAGMSPGGLWWSGDRGQSWRCVPGHAYVKALLGPRGRAG